MSETVPSVIAAIDPGLLCVMLPTLVTPEPVVVVVGVLVDVLVDVIVVVVVVVLPTAVLRERSTIALVRVRPPDLVKRDVKPGPDLEPEHPHDHREDRQRPPGFGAEHGSWGRSRHRSVCSILPGKRTLRKRRAGSWRVRATPTRGSARVHAHIFRDPRTPGARSAVEPCP